MSILIPNMTLPNNCNECQLCKYTGYGYSKCGGYSKWVLDEKNHTGMKERPSFCKLKEAPDKTGVIIPDREMPKDCGHCEMCGFSGYEYLMCYVSKCKTKYFKNGTTPVGLYTRPNWCELKEIKEELTQ